MILPAVLVGAAFAFWSASLAASLSCPAAPCAPSALPLAPSTLAAVGPACLATSFSRAASSSDCSNCGLATTRIRSGLFSMWPMAVLNFLRPAASASIAASVS
jgi:hypothetical protein